VSTAVFFISKDENLNKAHVQYLESRLIATAKEAKRCILDNGNVPQAPSLSEMDVADMEVFLDEMLLVFGVLGIGVFQKPLAATSSTLLLYLTAKGLKAVGYEVDDGFVAQAGSQSPREHVPSTPEPIARLRLTLLSQGVFVEEKGCWKMTQDYTFSSPSNGGGSSAGAVRKREDRVEGRPRPHPRSHSGGARRLDCGAVRRRRETRHKGCPAERDQCRTSVACKVYAIDYVVPLKREAPIRSATCSGNR
jgi:hypothetical protein